MCLKDPSENCGEAKHLSDTFPIKHALTPGAALLPLLFALNLEYDLMCHEQNARRYHNIRVGNK